MKQIIGSTVQKIGIIFFSAILFAGCAVQTKVMKTDSAFRPAKSPSEVEILLEEPVRSYKSIAIVEATDEGWELPLEDIKKKLVEKAAILGGDAVIIGRESQSTGAVIVPIGSSFYAAGVNETKLVGKVIIYEDSSETKTSSGKTIYTKRVEGRYVQKNIFHSTYQPEISVKIEHNYEYLGFDENVWRLKGYKVKTDNYIFCITGDDKTVQKMAVIKFRKIYKNYFNKNYLGTLKSAIDQGNYEINGKQYAYYTSKLSEKYVSNWNEILSKKGVNLSGSYLYKTIARRIQPKYDTVIYIAYYEKFDNKYSNYNWKSANALSNEQRYIVSEFGKHFDENIKILNSKDIALTTNSAPDKIEKNNEILKSSALEKKFKALNNLRESGLITQEDYNKKKSELLERF